jgi:hypothetical protein
MKTLEDQAVVKLIAGVEILLSDADTIKALELKNPVDILKQLIPIVINNDKFKFLLLFTECCKYAEKYFNTKNISKISSFGMIKFIKEIDNITNSIEVKNCTDEK